MTKIERILTIASMAIIIGCSYYSFVTLNQLMSHLNEIERVAKMGNNPSYQIVSLEVDICSTNSLSSIK
jgi:heme/copper-type cytochrome/quinol oxidase subunit 2